SRSCSNTIRTARSRTSGEYLADFAMSPSSQAPWPPAIPGRFTPGTSTASASCTRKASGGTVKDCVRRFGMVREDMADRDGAVP
ncbi:MAG: hypothetical protein AB1543_03820, partial [Candidatus Bipolaricaulota bacterium]